MIKRNINGWAYSTDPNEHPFPEFIGGKHAMQGITMLEKSLI
jgi:hypothetical protein